MAVDLSAAHGPCSWKYTVGDRYRIRTKTGVEFNGTVVELFKDHAYLQPDLPRSFPIYFNNLGVAPMAHFQILRQIT